MAATRYTRTTTQKETPMTAPATAPHEVRIDKTNVPSTAIRDQATVGLYFEYTYGMCMLDPQEGGKILLRNMSLFAVHNTLLLRRSVAEVMLPPNKAATFHATDLQQNFRSSTKCAELPEMTKEMAFLTVMRAWEFATMRPQVAHVKVQTPNGSTMPITVGAHWLISEPVQWPVTEKNTEALRKGDADGSVARRLCSQADSYWTDISTEPPADDGTPTHRFPRGEITKLDTSNLVGRIATDLVANDPADVPEYSPGFSSATDVLPDVLKSVAQSDRGW